MYPCAPCAKLLFKQPTTVLYYRAPTTFSSRNTANVTILESNPNENHSTPPVWLSCCQLRQCAERPHIFHLHIAAAGYKHGVPSFFGKTLAFLAVLSEIFRRSRIHVLFFGFFSSILCEESSCLLQPSIGSSALPVYGQFHACDQLPEALKK